MQNAASEQVVAAALEQTGSRALYCGPVSFSALIAKSDGLQRMWYSPLIKILAQEEI